MISVETLFETMISVETVLLFETTVSVEINVVVVVKGGGGRLLV